MKHIKSFQHATVDLNVNTDCSIFPLAKQSRLVFPRSCSRSVSPLLLLHMDVWGPYKFLTHDRKHFFLTTVDDHSRYTWAHLLQLKTDVIVTLQKFLSMLRT